MPTTLEEIHNGGGASVSKLVKAKQLWKAIWGKEGKETTSLSLEILV